ncbi:peptidase [Streptomyces actinomycinicus]|uniref:Peptidase n=1 Tax=Streptomyces actinomycinicus TaxID=1695166 RepID=A0A937EJ48_9ACTN|nr:peptidase [Streptomyces actinomycinicus]
MIAGARRRAVRDRDRQTDTAHLLHSLLEHDPEARSAVGGPPQLARLFGYLVQRSIGYGLRWQGRVEDSGVISAIPAQAGREGRDGEGEGRATAPSPAPAGPGGGPVDEAGGWSPAAAAALADARARARRRGAAFVNGTDLLAALVADPRTRAVEVLEHAGVHVVGLAARIEGGSGEQAADGGAAC